MEFKFNKQEFLDFTGTSRIDKGKALCERNGYSLEVSGRGENALFHLIVEVKNPEYTEFLTLAEVKVVTDETRADRALSKFKGGNNERVGHLVFYRKENTILDLEKVNRIRYVFTVNPLLASGFTYKTLGRMVGLNSKQAAYYTHRIAQEDGLRLDEHIFPYKTGYVRGDHVYTLEPHYSKALERAYYRKAYYDLDPFLNHMWERGYRIDLYREKIVNIENVHMMRKFEVENLVPALIPWKSQEVQNDLESIVSDLTATRTLITKFHR